MKTSFYLMIMIIYNIEKNFKMQNLKKHEKNIGKMILVSR